MRAFAAALIVLVALPAFPQEKLVESIEVRVVNVDVVVRDKAGNPVTGLTKDDFELWDGKVKQDITNIYEVRTDAGMITTASRPDVPASEAQAAAAPDELRQRKLIVFIDNYSILPMRRNEIFESLERFVDRSMRPGDQTMIVFWNRSLEVITPFTSDREILRRGIASLSGRSNAGFTNNQNVEYVKKRVTQLLEAAKIGVMTWPDAYDQSISMIEGYAEQISLDSQRMLEAFSKTSAALAGLEGKKVLVLAGAHLPERPGAELFQWMGETFSVAARMNTTSTTQTLGAQVGSLMSIDSALLYGATGAVGNMQRLKIGDAAREAAANGVTVYTIDAADNRDFVSADRASAVDENEKFTTYINSSASYSTIARITGGVALSNTDNFDSAFKTIGEDLSSYYSLGYKPQDYSGSGTQRKLVVRAKNPAYRIRYREVYSQKSNEEQMDDRVLSNIFNNETHGDWPVQVRTGQPVKEGKAYRVPVEIQIPSDVTLIPRDKAMVGGFTVFVAVGNAKGGMSDVSRAPRRLNIPIEAEPQLRAKPMTFSMVVMMAPGENLLSVGVLDQLSNVSGFARRQVLAR